MNQRPFFIRLAAYCMMLIILMGATAVSTSHRYHLDADIMKAALRTTTVEEDGYIEFVLAQVDKGLIPADVVTSTFDWARKKPKHQFQYFKAALNTRVRTSGLR